MSKNKEAKAKKILGGTKYTNSKKKKKNVKPVKNKIINDKNRSLKAKIKHLQKELKRVEDSMKENSGDKKILSQKSLLKEKIGKLLELLKRFSMKKKIERKKQ